MSALAPAPCVLAAPERDPHGTNRERPLRLLAPTPEPLSRNGFPVQALEAWASALDACSSALDAVEGMNVYAGPELHRRRRRLGDELRWLRGLRAMGPYDALPIFAHVRKSP